MRWFLSLAVIGAALWAASAAGAQPPRPPQPPQPPRAGGDDVRKLEAELDRLRAQVKELEGKLARSRDGDRRPDQPGDRKGDRKGDDRKDERKGDDRKDERKGDDRKGDRPEPRGPMPGGPGGMGPRFGPPFGPPGRGFGPFGPPGRGPDRDARPNQPAAGPADLERRLERIIDELEHLRNDIKRQQQPPPRR
jgi:hypothetical protein